MKNKSKYIGMLLSNDGFIVINKNLIKLIGLNSSILIGELVSEYNYYEKENKLIDKAWFYSTTPNIEENTGLSRYQQDEAIKKLQNKKIIDIKIMGMPSKRYFKINYENIEKLLKKDQKEPKNQGCKKLTSKVASANENTDYSQARLRETNKQGCEKLTSKVARNSHPRLLKTDNQGCKKLTIKVAKNSQQTIINNKNNNKNNITRIKNNLLLQEPKAKNEEEDFTTFLKNTDNLDKLNNTDDIVSKEILNIIKEIFNAKDQSVRISGKNIELKVLKNNLLTYNKEMYNEVVKLIKENINTIKNPKNYILTVLNNMPIKYNLKKSEFEEFNILHKKWGKIGFGI